MLGISQTEVDSSPAEIQSLILLAPGTSRSTSSIAVFSPFSFSHLLVRVFLISYFLNPSIPCKVAFEQKNKRSQISSLHLRDGVITGGKTRGSNSLGFWLSWKHVRPAERWALSAVGGKGTWGKLSATYPIGSDCMSAIPPRDEGWKYVNWWSQILNTHLNSREEGSGV